jgi:hypothetical protein
MKKLIIIFCWIVGLSFAVAPNVHIEKSRQLNIDQITTVNFNQFCKKVNKALTTNDLYIAEKRKDRSSAYFYGCDATGREKLTINCLRKDNQWLEVSLNVLIEGDLTNDQAEVSANVLLENMTRVLTSQETK